MSEFFSKIENFLFDLLGLILPGFIFLGVLITPLALVDISKIAPPDLEKSFILSELSTISNLFKNYWNEKSLLITSIIIVLAYLFGHFAKVFSIIKYEILVALFDKTFNKVMNYSYKKTKTGIEFLYKKISQQDFNNTKFYSWLKDIIKPIKNTLLKVFTFKSEDYINDNKDLKTECIKIINDRLNTNYPDKWYSIYKFSTIINNQENIRSLAAFFLAKYNLYRSLSFIFLFATIYFYFFFITTINYFQDGTQKSSSLILITTSLLWFTFHYKYKRYWTLCGNETLVSLYFYLNKKKINEV